MGPVSVRNHTAGQLTYTPDTGFAGTYTLTVSRNDAAITGLYSFQLLLVPAPRNLRSALGIQCPMVYRRQAQAIWKRPVQLTLIRSTAQRDRASYSTR